MTAKGQTLIKIFEKDKNMFIAYAETFTIGNAEVDDILNRALYKALNFAENITHPRALLFKEIRYAAYDLYTKRKRRERLFIPFLLEEKYTPPVYSTSITEHFSEETMQGYEYVTELQKTIVFYRIFGEWHFKDIAEVVGYSRSHTRTMYYDALEIIREELV